jgi:hypothetical protein
LEIPKKLSIEIDLKKDVVLPYLKMIQHDTNILEFVVKENGVDADLSNIGRIVVYYRRPDKKEIPRFLKAIGNKINYEIGYQEMKSHGEGQLEIQFYSLDNLERISTKRFKLYLSGSLGTDLVLESDKDLTVLQELFLEVSDLKTLAAQSTDIVESEAERIENEDFRTANEDTRIANESSRVSAESLRNTAENTRVNQEESREQAEVIREENEDNRLENETIRQSAESTRSQIEAIRQTKEDERLTNESNRVSAESTRQSNESNRQSYEDIRLNNEAQRVTAENVRKSAETSRNNAETVRNDNETVRQQQESDRQATIQQAVSAAQNANVAANTALSAANDVTINSAYAKEQAEKAKEAAETAKTYWLGPVANFAAISTTYPNALDGSQVITTDDQKQYRKINGGWTWTGVNSANGLSDVQARLQDANRQQQNLMHGTSIFAAALNSPVEFEVQGRTLTSLGNSNLEGGKLYVLADKRTKIRAEGREGTLINGVAKFTKSASVISKADFVGKVANSVIENAHIATRTSNDHTTIGLIPANSFLSEITDYITISSLNGVVRSSSTITANTQSQQRFSFNLIEHIERKHGRIPSDTVSGKVQWIKDNVNVLRANYHGFGVSVGGNGINVSIWQAIANIWETFGTSTSATVVKIVAALNSTQIPNRIDNNGFMHLLAYTTNPSDGTTPSQLNTDFVELEVELKSTAVLDTRPIITRVATFEGKVSGSLVENPHVLKGMQASTLKSPSEITFVHAQLATDRIMSLNGVNLTDSTITNGFMVQTLFSFNLIEEVERNIGRIPKATVAEKVQWLKDNVDRLTANWSGFGTSVGGNKASFGWWHTVNNNYDSIATTANGTVSTLVNWVGNMLPRIDVNGFVHLLAYAEPSDGTTASTINTDYISLDITLKQGATLHDPVLPLFEVDATDYANILVSWDENAVMSRFPKVQGVQHLQNLAVIAEGENLLPPFSDPAWILHADIKVVGQYELELNATAAWRIAYVIIPAVPNRSFRFDVVRSGSEEYTYLATLDSKGSIISEIGYSKLSTISKTTESNCSFIKIGLSSASSGKFTFTNPMLTIGSTAKPFVPRNPSYLFAQTKLGQIGTVKDSLFKNDGNWQLVERVKKDVVLDGSLGWLYNADFVGYKQFQIPFSGHTSGGKLAVTRFDGFLQTDTSLNEFLVGFTTSYLRISVHDYLTGFGETYTPTVDEIKAYFNGWQAKTVDANGKPTAWRSLGDGTDAPTQTLAYVSTNKAPNFTPYKLSYVLANPQTTNVNHLVEGDIAVSGSTQVEVTSGVVVREKATVVLNGGYALINDSAYNNKLKNKAAKIYDVYKGSQKDTVWTKINTVAHGTERVYTLQANYDATQDYYVTYLVLDRHLHTVNATEVKASYSGSLKDTVDMNNEKLSDVATQTSINTNLIYRLLLQAKANNWSV